MKCQILKIIKIGIFLGTKLAGDYVITKLYLNFLSFCSCFIRVLAAMVLA